MKMMRGYKYRLYPNPEQMQFLERHFGACRYVYNHFLELRQAAYKERGELVNGFACKRLLVPLKREHSWLKEINSQSLQQSVLDLESVYRRFVQKLGGYPQFKSKRSRQSFSVPQNFSIEDGKLHIPKLKSGITVKVHRKMVGVLKLATISREQTGKYYVSINCEFEPQVLPVVNRTEGVDLGLMHFAVLSSGEKIEHPKILKRSERRLKRAQRQLSRKVKGSRNRNALRYKVARIHEKIVNQRRDFLHKLSRRLINENQVISLEDLNVKGMVQNHHLAKSISDSGWGEFTRQVQYKADWAGRSVRYLPRFQASSKLCHICQFVVVDMKLSDRVWTCPNCGTLHDRDHNAAVNIDVIGQGMPELTPAERMTAAVSVLSMRQVSSKKQEALASRPEGVPNGSSFEMHGNLFP